MLNPTTPSKADNDIESLKTSLSAKWGIKFPPADFILSPSRRDLSRTEDRILGCMQFLYWKKDGSLGYAIDQFEKHAATVYSHWQFKPRGEEDVVPTRDASKSGLKKDFLHRQAPLGEMAVKDLTECLWSNLSQIAERVKKGEKFPKPLVEKPKAASIEPLAKANTPRRQSSITQWFRSKSEPNATTTSQQTSSDGFPDKEVTDLLDEVDCVRNHTTCVVPDPRFRKTSAPASPEDKFETPPSTPPYAKSLDLDTDASDSEHPASFYHRKPELIPISTRKRSFPESMKPPMPRKMSRDLRSHGAAYSMDNLRPNKKSAQQVAAITALPENAISFTSSSSTNRSSENLASMSTSFTSISTAWTSPNTSFHSDSMATSFNSDTGGLNSTIRASFGRSRDPLNGKFALQSEANMTASDGVDRAQGLPITDAGCDPMDIDLETNVASRTSVMPSFQSNESGGGQGFEAAESKLMDLLTERLRSYSPFSMELPYQYLTMPFRILYEIVRVSIHCKLDIKLFSTCLNSTCDSYEELWLSLSGVVKSHGKIMPERSSLTAWDRAGKDFQGVAITGKLNTLDQQKGGMFEFSLNPLKAESSYRLSRQFGSDRFAVFGIPGLDSDSLPTYLKPVADTAFEAVFNWLRKVDHHFLGRTWRAFYSKPEVSKKGQKALKSRENKTRFRVYFFAENGPGFRQGPRRGEVDPRLLDRPSMSVNDMVEWFMPVKGNEDQYCLKLYARLQLAVSSTKPTVVFKPDEIFRADDALAEAPCPCRLDRKRSDEKKTRIKVTKSEQSETVMNDGCARISRNAARGIADSLGLDSVPCVYQGRIGGAKGMWMIDPLDENPQDLDDRNYWIEITDSQLKFESHGIDALHPEAARVTFEVNDYPKKLTPSHLSFQLLPILENRGVPAKVFINLLEKDLTARVAEMEIAMDSGLALRKWNQTNNPVTQERAQYGGIEMQGGLPQSTAEKINWFVEHGFEPKTCRFLKDQLRKAITAYCLRLESKMNIGVAESTYAFMIADPLAVLEENEVHIAFSSAFRDHKTGVDQTMLHDIDVLVARSPAHLPSDIQKVRAVFKPELRLYRDVIVFPSKGFVSLANKLSGGDYDGDQAWVCWDPDIVEPFRNAQVPVLPKIEFYGMEKDKTKVSDLLSYPDYMDRILCRGMYFNLQPSMLGKCTGYHEKLCYHKNAIDSEYAIQIAGLLGLLVDSAKGGYIFKKTMWTNFIKNQNLPRDLTEPAYKDRNARPTKHLIDHLVHVTAKDIKDDVLKKFSEHFHDVPERDDDLFRLRNEAVEEAKANKELAQVLDNLKTGLKTIKDFWVKHAHIEDDELAYTTRKSHALTFRTLVERCREDFLNLAPTLSSPPTSDKITSWQRDHAAGRSSYWDLLKASVAFYHHYRSAFIWHVAGVELGEIKATSRGRGTYRPVIEEVFDAFKLDSRAVDGALRREMLEREGRGKVEGEGDDSDDEFGGLDIDVDDL